MLKYIPFIIYSITTKIRIIQDKYQEWGDSKHVKSYWTYFFQYQKGFNKQRYNAFKDSYHSGDSYSNYYETSYNTYNNYHINNSNYNNSNDSQTNYGNEAQYNYNHPRRKREMRYDECFPGVQEPLYGFKVKVTIAENSPCTLGATCRGDPSSSLNFGTVSNLISGRAGEDYNYLQDTIDFEDPNNLDRQTGEDFFSEAPPDCRVTCGWFDVDMTISKIPNTKCLQ